MIDETNKLIKLDSRFKTLVKKFGYPNYKKEKDYFKALIRIIIFQQLSVKSARAISLRFFKIYNDHDILSPEIIKSTNIIFLKNAGLSKQKINYIFNFCDYCTNNNLNKIDNLDNKQIYHRLTEIKGIGQWTVDMFLMFTLNRKDIFPVGDLGIKKGLMKFEKLAELPSTTQIQIISKKWKPYRSIAAWYMWIIIEGPFEW
tara:strand:+ start:56 stop:658 length:603 start_codon:yes stop_codon:yes gene_type:complete